MSTFEDDPAGEIAGLISSEWDYENPTDGLIAMSLRVPANRLAVIDGMSKKAGVSRNRMANMLLAAGCKAVIALLDEGVLDELRQTTEEES